MESDGLFGIAFERGADERRRLEYQFELLSEDFDLWFDAALRRAGLEVDAARADWTVLDAGHDRPLVSAVVLPVPEHC
jgi:hypothetical protein